MNIVFWAIVLLAAVILWFCINSLFPKIGGIICELIDETKSNMTDKEEKDKVEAQGKADAKIIAAEAEAKSNKLISDSLTDKLIERQKVSKWKGDVPKVQGSGTPIIDIGDLE